MVENELDQLKFDLRETLRAVLHLFGPEGARKVTEHVVRVRKVRDVNAELGTPKGMAALNAMADVVLRYRPKPKSKPTRKRRRNRLATEREIEQSRAETYRKMREKKS